MMQPRVRVKRLDGGLGDEQPSVLRLMAISRSSASTVVSPMGPKVVSPPATLTTTSRRPKCLSADLHGERRDVRLGQVARAGPGVHTLGGKLAYPLGDTDGVEIAGNDLGPGLAERERHGVPDLAGPAHTGHQHDLPTKIEPGGAHSDPRLSRMMRGAGRTGLGVEHGAVAVDQADRTRDPRHDRLERAIGTADRQVRDRTATGNGSPSFSAYAVCRSTDAGFTPKGRMSWSV